MNKLWNAIEAWFTKHGGYAHVVAAAWLTISVAYDSVPQFKDAVVGGFAASPTWLHRVVAVAVPLYLWYTNTHKRRDE